MLAPPVVPEHPAPVGADSKRLVARIRIPAIRSRTHDWIASVLDPAGYSVLRSSHADLRVINVAKPDVEDVIPSLPVNHLAGCDPIALPVVVRVRPEHWIGRIFLPDKAIHARGIADSVRLVLRTGGVPHFPLMLILIPKNIRTHHGNVFP